MMLIFTYPAILKPDEDGRPVVTFPDLPGAVTDGADEAEALSDAVDCLSEALAARMVRGEDVPPASVAQPGQHLVSPDPTIALKAALYLRLRERDMTVADLADLLGVDWHQAARLIDPRRLSKLTSLQTALGALELRITITVSDGSAADRGASRYSENDPVAEQEWARKYLCIPDASSEKEASARAELARQTPQKTS